MEVIASILIGLAVAVFQGPARDLYVGLKSKWWSPICEKGQEFSTILTKSGEWLGPCWVEDKTMFKVMIVRKSDFAWEKKRRFTEWTTFQRG